MKSGWQTRCNSNCFPQDVDVLLSFAIFSHDFSGVANRAGWEVMLAILAHPEVGGESEDDEAKTRHEGLLCQRARNDGIRILVDNGNFKDLEADHDKTHGG